MEEMLAMLKRNSLILLIVLAHTLFALNAATVGHASEADVVKVNILSTGDRVYRIDVTVRHADSGWDHYANRWEVRTLDGKVLGIRELAHPHVQEQPFTRSLRGVAIPKGIEKVELRAHDSVHDYGGKTIAVQVPD
jgi:hypothetical protein